MPPDPPPALGRGVVVEAGAPAPAPWADAPVISVDADLLDGPSPALSALHRAWLRREPVVVALGIDPAHLREPETVAEPPWSVDPGLVLATDRLRHLVWANNYDARRGEPIWWWARKAARLEGCSLASSGGADVVITDGVGGGQQGDQRRVDPAGGRAAWVDGGPRWSVPALGQGVVHAESVEAGRLAAVPSEAPPEADLAPDQLAAVAHPGGPVRVIAPAGSGKTRVLTERLRHLLGGRGYERSGLLGVAYNKEAERELSERLAELRPRTRTLNSLGFHLLALHRGARPAVLEEPQARRLAEEVFPIPRRRTNTDPVGPYIEALTRVRLALVDPEQVESERDDVPGLAAGFERYRDRLHEAGAIDFDEQVYAAIEALLRDGAFRRRVQPAHRHLLVDEFQDLTPAHVLLLRLLAMPTLDVFGVGDDDQTIYDHAGADPRFLVGFEELFPGAGAVALELNYRCPEATVEAATNLLRRNRVRVAKAIRPAPGAPADPGALTIDAHPAGASASALVELLGGWLAEPGAPAAEIAVLARVNSLLLAPQLALQAAGVPVRPALSAQVLERTGVAAALAWIRVATGPTEVRPADLAVIAHRPSRGFPRWISKWLERCRSLEDLWRVADRIDDRRVSERVAELAGDVEAAAGVARGGSTRSLLEAIRDRIGLGGAMEGLDGSKGSQAAASHLDDLEALLQVAELEPEPRRFEPWLRSALERPADSGGVTLSTVHRVKGREWDRVAVYGVSAGILPHRLAADPEAERRVLHVAITRARLRCAVLGDSARPSPFLAELRGEEPAVEAASDHRAPGASGVPRVGPPTAPGGRAPAASASAPASPEAEAAERVLREWRTRRAGRDGVPAYVVLSNRQLEGIAGAMPVDAAALRRCDGIGPTRLERYGDEILAALDSVR